MRVLRKSVSRNSFFRKFCLLWSGIYTPIGRKRVQISNGT